jgi:hypothetical protein
MLKAYNAHLVLGISLDSHYLAVLEGAQWISVVFLTF